jgi:hypothetical protein
LTAITFERDGLGVGLYDSWVAARGIDPGALKEHVEQILGQHGDWVWARTPFQAPDITAALGVPAIGGYVADSEWGVLTAAGPDGLQADLLINGMDEEFDEMAGEPLSIRWTDPERRRVAFEELAAWSRVHGPRAVTAEELLAAMPGTGTTEPDDAIFEGQHPVWMDVEERLLWMFPENGLRLIFHRLGFPDLEEIVFSQPGRPRVEDFPLRTAKPRRRRLFRRR